jgi:hypothetical protein
VELKALSFETARLRATSLPIPATTFLALGDDPGAFVFTELR